MTLGILYLAMLFSQGIRLGLLFVLIAQYLPAEAKVYSVHCDSTPPYTFYDQGRGAVSGFWAELVIETMSRMGEQHDPIRIYPWKRLKESGFSGSVDGVFGAQQNEERAAAMWFPDEPLSEETWVLWIRKSDLTRIKFENHDDLDGLRAGLVRGYNYPREFMDYLAAGQQLDEVSSEELNFRKLSAGRIDYTVSLIGIGYTISDTLGIRDEVVPIIENPLFSSKFYVMFSKETVSKDWVDRFSQVLSEFKRTEEYDLLRERFIR